MGFYKEFYDKFKAHLLVKPVDSFFISSSENVNRMRTTYQALGSLTRFLEYLEQKVIEELALEEGFLNEPGAAAFTSFKGDIVL